MWYRDLFRDRWAKFWVEEYLSELMEDTMDDIEFLRTALRKGVTLDMCCGPGRHSIPLSSYMDVVSFDLSRDFLLAIKDRSGDKSLHLVQGDMRKLPFKDESFDNVINMHTSFGYFSDKENKLVLQEVSRILKPEGLFILDIANAKWFLGNFRERGWDESDSFYVLEKRNLDWETRRMVSRWILIDKKGGSIDELVVDHRLYDLNELKNLLAQVNLEILNVFGSSKKERFHEILSRRILIIAKKH
ncbi:MAG: class I SAM-dependent methyltransferase [Candidatus Bathyarchaeia archaeon]